MRYKNHRQQHQEPPGQPFHIAGYHTRCIGDARGADHHGGTDIGSEYGKPNIWPLQGPAGQKEVISVFFSEADPEPQGKKSGYVQQNDKEIQGIQGL